jgi:tight adherence protein B
MALLILTIAALVALYFVVTIVFPKAVPDELSAHTQKSLDKIYQENKEAFQDEKEVGINTSLDEESAFVGAFFRLPLMSQLYPLVLKAGMHGQLLSLIGVYLILSFALVLLSFALGNLLLGLFVALVMPYFIIKIFLRRKIVKRNQMFIDSFPDVLDMFVRSFKSGSPISSAFRLVAENMDPPVSTEFQRIVQELAMGQSMNACLTRMAQRIDEPDIQFFVVVMKVQQESGGNLAEVVGNLSGVIRKRKQLRLKIKALTSEGRATSYVLGSLPLLVTGALMFVSPEYLEPLWTTSMGMIWAGVAAALFVGCMMLVNQLIKIDI